MLAQLGEWFSGQPQPSLPPPPSPEPDEALPVEDEPRQHVELQLVLPMDAEPSVETFAQCITGLSRACQHPLGFELLGLAGSLSIQLVASASDADMVTAQLAAHFPELVITKANKTLSDAWEKIDATETLIVECGLSREFMRPLRLHDDFAVDPLVALTAALSQLRRGELGMLQILFERVCHPHCSCRSRYLARPSAATKSPPGYDCPTGRTHKPDVKRLPACCSIRYEPKVPQKRNSG
jgi:hypothetical protein